MMHFKVDTSAGTATDWATYPGSTDPRPVTYAAKSTDGQVTWSTPPDPS